MRCRNRCLLPAAAVIVLAPICLAEVTLPRPTGFVADHADLIDNSTEQRIAGWLAELRQKTKAFVLVVTVPSMEGEDIFDFAQRHFDTWKPGAEGRDKAAIIIVRPKTDTQTGAARIHTGYGMEATLPDSWCGSLARSAIKDHFRTGNYSKGIETMAVGAANKIADSENISLSGIPAFRHRPRQPGSVVCGGGLLPLVIMLIVMSSMGRRSRHYGRWGGGGLMGGLLWGSILGSMMGGGRSSGWGSGGSGFGGGGFSGGFGGGFGGGMSGGGGGGGSW